MILGNIARWKRKGGRLVAFDLYIYYSLYAGEARIRVQISAAHSTEEIERCIEAFVDVGKRKGVI